MVWKVDADQSIEYMLAVSISAERSANYHVVHDEPCLGRVVVRAETSFGAILIKLEQLAAQKASHILPLLTHFY